MQDMIPRHMHIVAEYQTALINMGVDVPRGEFPARVLDIGCGIGYFAPFFLGLGYQYEGIEMDTWASRYVRSAYMVTTHNCAFEDFDGARQWDAIVASHVVEHFQDAPRQLARILEMLKPGGRFYGIIPEGSDLGNPDHEWFFPEGAIERWLDELGFVEIRTYCANVVPYERFIYLAAEKPLTNTCELCTIQVDN